MGENYRLTRGNSCEIKGDQTGDTEMLLIASLASIVIVVAFVMADAE